jgi:SNF family Na+-dependent transporter
MWNNRLIKYFGLIGIFGPIVIYAFYVYVESWTLGYSVFSLAGSYDQAVDLKNPKNMTDFLDSYTAAGSSRFPLAYLFFVVTFAANLGVIYFGISRGIEKLCKFAMPALLVMAVIIAVRVVTLPPPPGGAPDQTVSHGFGFLWNPDFSVLLDPAVWLAAAGQVFFTLSVGIGVILTYASYLSKHDDVALSGLTAASTNEFAEVILGATIVIPAAVVFFGTAGAQAQAAEGPFNITFVTMPLVFSQT